MQQEILIIGGSGLIGSQIQEILKNRNSDLSIWIGSRKKVRENYLEIDINNITTFDVIETKGINLVVLCTVDDKDNMLTYCIEKGINYLDITKPTPNIVQAYETVKVKDVNSKIVFSSGWMGGAIPSLVSHFRKCSDLLEEVKVFIYYSLKDKAGKTSADFMAENVSNPFPIYQDNKEKMVRFFEGSEPHIFMFNKKKLRLYNFDIPDVYILNRIEKVPNVLAKVTYSSSATSKILSIMQKFNIFNQFSLNTKKKLFYSSGNGDLTAFDIAIKEFGGDPLNVALVCTKGQAYLTAYLTSLHIEKILTDNFPNQLCMSYQLYQDVELINKLQEDKSITIETS